MTDTEFEAGKANVKTGLEAGYKIGYEQAKKDFERPRGEWLTQWKDTCSQCKKEFDVPTGDNGKALWNYCPNCGADMRKKDGDKNG